MSAAFQTIKLNGNLVDLARQDAPLFSRSIAGQVEHWARLGRAVESAPGFTLARVRAALAGTLDAGSLSDDEWTLFEDMRFSALGEDPNPAVDAYFAELGRQPGAVGDDAAGRLLRIGPDGSAKVIEG